MTEQLEFEKKKRSGWGWLGRGGEGGGGGGGDPCMCWLVSKVVTVSSTDRNCVILNSWVSSTDHSAHFILGLSV